MVSGGMVKGWGLGLKGDNEVEMSNMKFVFSTFIREVIFLIYKKFIFLKENLFQNI